MGINIDHFSCVNCHSSNLKRVEEYISCQECETKFPVINERIPLMTLNWKRLVAETFRQYSQFLELNSQECAQLKRGGNPYRNKEGIEHLVAAKTCNARIIEGFRSELRPFLDMEMVAGLNDNADLRYLTNWDYLRRDWSYEEIEEFEIEKTLATVLSEITEEQQKGNAIVLGAGAGRIVYELSDVHEKVFAVDNTFTMVGLYHLVRDEWVRFFEINELNVLKNKDRCVDRVAHMRVVKDNVRPEYYFWGDATALPLLDCSLTRVYSIYFTDVLPLAKLLKEVDRVLMPGGDFVHFGPLYYHFQNPNDMLTAEEIEQAFVENGYEIIENRTVELSHHRSSVSMMHRVYNNWFFIARKQRGSVFNVTDETVYALESEISYSAHGKISIDEDEGEIAIEMITSDGSKYGTTELILEAIRCADGILNFAQIVRKIESEYEQTIPVNDLEELKRILAELAQKKVIKIIS